MESEEFILECQNNDEVSLDLFIKNNSNLVKSLRSRHFGGFGSLREDLEQEGLLGALEAVRRYKKGFSKQFPAYKSLWIKKFMQNFIRKNKPLCALPESYDSVSNEASAAFLTDYHFLLDFLKKSPIKQGRNFKKQFKQLLRR